MYFSIVIISLCLVFISFSFIRLYKLDRVFEINLYDGVYSGDRLKMGQNTSNPPKVYTNGNGGSLFVNDIGDSKYILFRTVSGEHILVNQDEKEVPIVGEKVIVRHRDSGNYFVHSIKYIYSDYDDISDYVFVLEDDTEVYYQEIVGTLKHKSIER